MIGSIASRISRRLDAIAMERVRAAFRRNDPPWSLLYEINRALRPEQNMPSPDGLTTPRGFEDLTWLFTPSTLEHAVIRMDLDEAALLYRTARAHAGGRALEVGRFRGGSLVLFLTALGQGGRIMSIDIAPQDDAAIKAILRAFGWEDRVNLVVGDSRTYPLPIEPYDLALLDGDHTYEGVRADVERWAPTVRPGGDVLIDNVGRGRSYSAVHPEAERAIKDLLAERTIGLELVETVASVVRLRRT